ncbi:hypothetical protein LJY25_06250 [Hymenobacter sp. BT175]|uniref:hypothetical protein n=1 Tax=Hymenobacter translucens TaxID=2886507 RepID=UPI001D0E4BDB|nr:hypothetical protein [Hymenobacter translucens]MCC2546039.1 hypothetical protein [Hymenobacter translucens]
MTRFLRNLAFFCVVLWAIMYGLHLQFGAAVIHRLAYFILGFFALLTAFTYWLTARLVKADADNFMAAYFGSMVARLLISVGLILVYFYRGGAKEGPGTWAFLGSFFLLYFLFAGFEVWSILTNLRPFSKPA